MCYSCAASDFPFLSHEIIPKEVTIKASVRNAHNIPASLPVSLY